MSFYADITTAKTGTGAAGTTIDVALDLGGLTPKVIWAWMVGRTDVADATGNANAVVSYGFAVSTSARRCMISASANNVSPTQADRDRRDDCVLGALSTAGAINGRLDVNSTGANTVQLIVDQQFSSDFTFFVAAIAGTDITNATVTNFTAQAASGSQSVTSIGHPGRYMEFLYSGGASVNSPFQNAQISIGRAYAPDAASHLLSFGAVDNVSPSDTGSYCIDSECFALYNSSLGPVFRFSVTGSLSNGFTINRIDAQGFTADVPCLVVDGTFRCKFGTANTETGTSNEVSLSPGFDPLLTFFMSHCKTTQSSAGTRQNGAALSLGAARGLTGYKQYVGSIGETHGASPSNMTTSVDFDSVYQNAVSGAVDGNMAVITSASMAHAVEKTRMTDGDPTQRVFFWQAFAGAAPVAGSTFIADVQFATTSTVTGTFSLSMPNLLAAGEVVKVIRVSAGGADLPGEPPENTITEQDAAPSYGVGVRSGAQIAYASFMDTGADPSNTARGRAAGVVALEVDTAGAQTGAIRWIPTNVAGDVTLEITDAFVSNRGFTVEAWGGDAITDAAVVGFDRTTGTGSLAVTVGMQTRYLELLNGQMASGTNAAEDATFSLGRCWVPTLDQHVVSFYSDDAVVAGANTSAYGASGEVCADIVPTGGGAFGGRTAVSSAGATSVTLNRIESGSTEQCHMLVVAGTFSGQLGTFQTLTTPDPFGPGASAFTHKAESLWSVNSLINTQDTSVSEAAWSIGAYASSGQTVGGFEDLDGTTPSLSLTAYASADAVYVNPFEGVFAERTGPGTYAFASGDDGQNYVYYAFFGDQEAGGGTSTRFRLGAERGTQLNSSQLRRGNFGIY